MILYFTWQAALRGGILRSVVSFGRYDFRCFAMTYKIDDAFENIKESHGWVCEKFARLVLSVKIFFLKLKLNGLTSLYRMLLIKIKELTTL